MAIVDTDINFWEMYYSMMKKANPVERKNRANTIVSYALLGTAIAGIVLMTFSPLPPSNTTIWGLGTGFLLGMISGYLIFKLPFKVQKWVNEFWAYLLLSPLFLGPSFVVIVLLGCLLDFGLTQIAKYFEITQKVVTYIDIGVWVFIGFEMIRIMRDFFFDGISKDLWVRKINIEEINTDCANENMSNAWEDFQSKIREGDEIWYWSTPQWTWDKLMGRCGCVIVRNGQSTRHSITIGMN